MSDQTKTATGLSALGALFVLLAANGEKFWAGMLAAWKFLLAISDSSPLGVGAFFSALAFATCVTIILRRFLPNPANAHRRAVVIEFTAIAVALLVASIQVTQPINAVMVGLMAGLSASLGARVVMALATWIGNLLPVRP